MRRRRRIAAFTSGRQDYGILRSTLLRLEEDPRFDLRLLVGGMHLSGRYGSTVGFVVRDGFRRIEQLDWLRGRGERASLPSQAGAVVCLVGQTLRRHRPEFLILVGDRYETGAAALAATLERIPVAHLHGGEETEGALDNAIRHAVTKMSHLHLVSHPVHAARIVQMGEDPRSVHVVGPPGVDNLERPDLPDLAALRRFLGMSLEPPVVIVTLLPTTLGDSRAELRAVLGAMELVRATYVITLPNSDPGHEGIRRSLLRFARRRARAVAVASLGERRYWGLLRVADALLGNSSSALIEAPALRVPAVDVGDRQKGRLAGPNVLHSSAQSGGVARALRRALNPAFRQRLGSYPLPYASGGVASRIVRILAHWRPPHPPRKGFVWNATAPTPSPRPAAEDYGS